MSALLAPLLLHHAPPSVAEEVEPQPLPQVGHNQYRYLTTLKGKPRNVGPALLLLHHAPPSVAKEVELQPLPQV